MDRPSLPLSIVVPAYNEAGAIRAGRLAAVAAWRDAHRPAAEIVVVDDGSTDDTAEAAHRALAALAGDADRVLTIPHGGKAAAVAAGFRAARGDVVLFTDMDLATPIADADGLLRALDGGADVAIGSRGLHRAGAPPGRRVLSSGQVLLRVLLHADFIIDVRRRPLDGNHIGGRLPSGNGRPGDDFLSWFSLPGPT